MLTQTRFQGFLGKIAEMFIQSGFQGFLSLLPNNSLTENDATQPHSQPTTPIAHSARVFDWKVSARIIFDAGEFGRSGVGRSRLIIPAWNTISKTFHKPSGLDTS